MHKNLGRLSGFIVAWLLAASPSSADIVAGPARAAQPRLLPGGLKRADLVLVKFEDGQTIRLREGRLSDLGTKALERAEPLLEEIARLGCTWERAYPGISEEKLEQMRDRGRQSLKKEVPDQNLRFRLNIPGGVDTLALIARLEALPQVRRAEAFNVPVPPPLPPDYVPQQGYLAAAPAAIGVLKVAEEYGIRGAGVAICDVEYGFNAAHADLPAVTILGGPPSLPEPSYSDHGTAVLGQLAGRDNEFGVLGACADAEVYFAPVNVGGVQSVDGCNHGCGGQLGAGRCSAHRAADVWPEPLRHRRPWTGACRVGSGLLRRHRDRGWYGDRGC